MSRKKSTTEEAYLGACRRELLCIYYRTIARPKIESAGGKAGRFAQWLKEAELPDEYELFSELSLVIAGRLRAMISEKEKGGN